MQKIPFLGEKLCGMISWRHIFQYMASSHHLANGFDAWLSEIESFNLL